MGLPLIWEYFHNIWDMFRENHNWLVVDLPTPLKNHGVLVTVGMMTFPTVSGKS
jgi:hypothetical protein